MDASPNKKGRGIWSEEENKHLISLAKGKQRMSWNEIGTEVSKHCETQKSGKQCRERYRNYADPSLETSEWKPQEKLLFLVLHKFYGNQWSNIAKHMNQRSDVVVKNYFYSIARKALKLYKTSSVPASLLKKPSKFYQVYMILEHIKEHYLPVIEDAPSLLKYSHKEKIILNLLKERGVTEDSITKYEEQLIKKVKESCKASASPHELAVSLEEFNFTYAKAEELVSNDKLYNPAPLNGLIKLQVSVKPLPSTQKLPSLIATAPVVPQQQNYFLQLNPMSNPFLYMANQYMAQMQNLQSLCPPILPPPTSTANPMSSVQPFQFYPTLSTPPTMTFLPSFQQSLAVAAAQIEQMKKSSSSGSFSSLTALLGSSGVVDGEQLEPECKIKK